MSRLLSAADYRRAIADVDAVLVDWLRRLDGNPDFGAQLGVRSLQDRRAQLAEELARFGDRGLPGQDLAVAISGAPVVATTIEADFVGQVLRHIQAIVNSILLSRSGASGRRGRLTDSVKKAGQLRLAGTFEGSFGLSLIAADGQRLLDGDVSLGDTFKSFLDLVGNPPDNTGSLLEQLSQLGPRPAASYRQFVRDLARHRADIVVSWERVAGTRVESLTAKQADQLLEVLDRVQQRTEDVFVHGKLDGANSRLGNFELETDDGEIIRGSVDPQIVPLLKDFFDRRCRAHLLMRTTTDRGTGEERVAYELQALTAPNS